MNGFSRRTTDMLMAVLVSVMLTLILACTTTNSKVTCLNIHLTGCNTGVLRTMINFMGTIFEVLGTFVRSVSGCGGITTHTTIKTFRGNGIGVN